MSCWREGGGRGNGHIYRTRLTFADCWPVGRSKRMPRRTEREQRKGPVLSKRWKKYRAGVRQGGDSMVGRQMDADAFCSSRYAQLGPCLAERTGLSSCGLESFVVLFNSVAILVIITRPLDHYSVTADQKGGCYVSPKTGVVFRELISKNSTNSAG